MPTSHCPSPLSRLALAMPRAVALACAMVWPLGAAAQSLQVLYGVAKGYDASYLSARLQADAIGLKAEQARAALRPTVSANATTSVTRSDTPWASVSRSQSLQQSAGISAQYTLFNPANAVAVSQAEINLALAQAQMRASEQDLMMRVTQAYFDVLAAADGLATVQASKRAIAEQLAAAKHNFVVGSATITDTREAEARLDLVRAQELGADNDLRTARLALDALVGRKGLQPRPLATPAQLPALVPAEVDEWERLADDANPVVQQLRLARDVSQLEIDRARSAGLPTVALTAALNLTAARLQGRNKATDGTTLPFGPNNGVGPSASVGMQVNMPLYTGGLIQSRLQETLVLVQKADADLEAARRTVAQATRTAFYAVQTQLARAAALEAAEASSAMALEATELGYKVGVRVNLDVLNAQTQLYQAQRDLAKSRYDVLVGLLKLKQTAGVLQPPDIAAVASLMAR